ncbi:MAG: L,D-transpeptidase [Kiritimatiellae bacterium]|nr:L,D-transpeptidase [Kiritimatiellia bacterium]
MMRAISVWKQIVSLSVLALAGCATMPPDLPPVPVEHVPSQPGRKAAPPRPLPREPRAPTSASRASMPPRGDGAPSRTPVPVAAPSAPAVPVAAPAPIEPAAPQVAPQAAPLEDEVLRLQVLLDRANFSPGCLDGRWGAQTRAALMAWQRREGAAPTGEVDEGLRVQLAALADVFTTHVVTEEEHAALRPRLTGWVEKSAADHLGFSTILEAIAERYHSTERAMREWNPSAQWPDPPPGTALRVPNVRSVQRLWAARVEIHLATKYLQAFDGEGRVVAYFPCSIARQVEKRPVGELHIANAAENPNYTFDPALFSDDPAAAGIGRKLIIPPGPNNPVGVAWLSLDRPGYGIHGTPEPEKIGKTESHGCFRLSNWNASKLLGMISIGTPVFVYE